MVPNSRQASVESEIFVFRHQIGGPIGGPQKRYPRFDCAGFFLSSAAQ
jgi:hypothetical protein